MPREHQYFVYILASRSRTLYIGITNNLILRILQHREGRADAFTARYKITRLVYFERFGYIDKAIAREKFLKHFTRQEKIALILATNPTGRTSPLIYSRIAQDEKQKQILRCAKDDKLEMVSRIVFLTNTLAPPSPFRTPHRSAPLTLPLPHPLSSFAEGGGSAFPAADARSSTEAVMLK